MTRAVADPVDAVAVVVPARDEAALLPRCLDHLGAALEDVARRRPRLVVRIVIALDRCTDASGEVVDRAIARGVARDALRAVEVDAGGPGRARALGLAAALGEPELARIAARDPRRVWVANTDADSGVPPTWIHEHVGAAERGADVLVGAVTPDPADLEPTVLAAWRARHRLDDGHGHVFGANLGFRLDAYRLVGGFAPATAGEDRGFVAAARAAGLAVVATGDAPVSTSGRRRSRTVGGFATYLERLSDATRPRPGEHAPPSPRSYETCSDRATGL